jgi:hypothetical protein
VVGVALAIMSFVLVNTTFRNQIAVGELRRVTDGMVQTALKSGTDAAMAAMPDPEEFDRRVDRLARNYGLGAAATALLLTAVIDGLIARRRNAKAG